MISAERLVEVKYQFPTPSSELIPMASKLIGSFARRGLMLAQTPADLAKIAEKNKLVLAVAHGQVIGSAAYTVEYMDGTWEFGAWAVQEDYQNNQEQRVGRHLLGELINAHQIPQKAIALANQEYSSPIFAKLGGALIRDHSTLDPEIFNPCKSCNCLVRASLQPNRLCVDDIYDLTEVFRRIKQVGK